MSFEKLLEKLNESTKAKVRMPDGRVFDAEIFSAEEVEAGAKKYREKNAK